jgi:integrase
VRDAFYWVVLIIAHTGMRREEICQLRVEHLCRDDDSGIWFFNLKAEGLDLKDTANEENEDEIAAKRWVPVPDALIELGIIEYLHANRDPSEQLFRDLRPYGTDKKFGTKVGKDFERYRRNYDKLCRA